MSDLQCRALIARAQKNHRSALAQLGWEYAGTEERQSMDYLTASRIFGAQWAIGYTEYWGE